MPPEWIEMFIAYGEGRTDIKMRDISNRGRSLLPCIAPLHAKLAGFVPFPHLDGRIMWPCSPDFATP